MDAKKGLWIIGGVAVAITGAIGAGLYYSFRQPSINGVDEEENWLLQKKEREWIAKHAFDDRLYPEVERYDAIQVCISMATGRHQRGPDFRRFVDRCVWKYGHNKLTAEEVRKFGLLNR